MPDHDLLQVVIGYGETGAALCRADVDKLAFTGSTATGKKVMATCAENLTPVLIEAGGKDALLVDEDADVVAAADAAAWGAFSNAGQTCIGIERVYVHDRVHDRFVAELARRAGTVHAGTDAEAKIGPMTMGSQVDVVRRHVEDALARGGRAVVGGGRRRGRPVRPADRAGRRARGLRGRPRGDVRPDRHRASRAGHGRGRRAGQRDPLRPRLGGLLRRRAGPSWPAGCARG